MSDSERPSRPHLQPPSFEVPDLELEPVPRSIRKAAPKSVRPVAAKGKANSSASAQEQMFGSSFDFGDDLDDLEFERSAQPTFQTVTQSATRVAVAKRAAPVTAEPEPSWPTGRAPELAELELDPRELAILADYGEPPISAPLTIAYAYRVFTRQRELKHQLIPITAESERAQSEREATLAEFAREMRPTIEQLPEFRRFFAPLRELERRGAERGQALTAINAQLGAESGQMGAELTQIAGQLEVEQRAEQEAQRHYDDREANAKRAEAKLKRVQIEMRAVTQVAEQKLAPQGGQVPAVEAAQLAELEQRARAMQPDVTQARAELEQAKQALGQVHARLDALRQSERQINRKKQLLSGAYQKELTARTQGVSETEIEQRAALADLGRAVLASPDALEISEQWIERLRGASERADRLLVRAEMLRRASVSYDAERAKQGVRLMCTAVGLLLALFAFKLFF